VPATCPHRRCRYGGRICSPCLVCLHKTLAGIRSLHYAWTTDWQGGRYNYTIRLRFTRRSTATWPHYHTTILRYGLPVLGWCTAAWINKLCAWWHNMPRPSPPPGRQAPRAPPSRRNVAVLSHAEYVPTLTAAAALRVKAALSKAAWWPW